MRGYTLVRAGILCLLAVTVLSLVAGAVGGTGGAAGGTDLGDRDDVLFITTQGTMTLEGQQSAAEAVDTETGNVIWSHESYERYFDIEPINDSVVLFLGADGPHGANMWANVVDWTTGERLQRFAVPNDTHDIDHLGDDRYAIADKEDHRLLVYDAGTNETVWEYVYAEHYPDSAGGGEDFTHVNDIDAVDDGSRFLASPRNFDRVMLVDRESKKTVRTLGSEDDYEVLHEQHNPTLLERDPPTVLVADSENDRIVEYRRTNGEWRQVWAYSGSLSWPRDADRLPNGNTLVVDSSGQRVLEVTPGREVVWEITVTKMPYDADLLSLGEEPRGPSMTEYRDRFDGAEGETSEQRRLVGQMESAVALLQWVVPWNINALDVLLLLTVGGLGVFWTGFELSLRERRRETTLPGGLSEGMALFTLVGVPVSGWLLWAPGVDQFAAPIWRGIGVLVLGTALLSVPDDWLDRSGSSGLQQSLRGQVKPVVAALGLGVCLGLVFTTYLNALYLSAGAFFTLVGYRSVALVDRSPRFVRGYVALGYLLRGGAIAPVVVLVHVSQSSPWTSVYLGLGVLLLGSMALPHAGSHNLFQRWDDSAFGPVVAGWRAVVFAVTVVALVGLCYSVTRPTTLTGVFTGLVVVLLRNAVLLLQA